VHPAAGGDGLARQADVHAVAQHRRAGGDVHQRHLVALRHAVAQRQAVGQHGAGVQAAVVGHDGDVVALVHADAPPTRVMFLPIFSSSGLTRSNTAASPPHMMVSDAALAPTSPPETGASM
jgi:hypothetical protein